MADEQPEWARTEYVCVCGEKFRRCHEKQKRCPDCEPVGGVALVSPAVDAPAAKELLGVAELLFEQALQAFCNAIVAGATRKQLAAMQQKQVATSAMCFFNDSTGMAVKMAVAFGHHKPLNDEVLAMIAKGVEERGW